MSAFAKKPLLVGIAGGSGAGKTTIAKILRNETLRPEGRSFSL